MVYWVCRYFKGFGAGLQHAMMVTNLIRSVHMFSTEPIVVFVVDTPMGRLSPDWDPTVFPRLIVFHAGPLESMQGGDVTRHLAHGICLLWWTTQNTHLPAKVT